MHKERANSAVGTAWEAPEGLSTPMLTEHVMLLIICLSWGRFNTYGLQEEVSRQLRP